MTRTLLALAVCYRFGWRFSSDMPDIYISRAGMETLELDEKFTQTELSTLKDDLSRLSRDNHLKDERILQLQRSIAELTKNFQSIQQILAELERDYPTRCSDV